MNSSAISAIKRLLIQLESQFRRIEHAFSSLNQQDKQPFSPYFDSALFSPLHHHPQSYLAEVNQNLQRIHQLLLHPSEQQLFFLIERTAAQILALQRELSTHELRKKEQSQQNNKTKRSPYEQLSQYQDYQRRLKAMIREREHTLEHTPHFTERVQLEKELAALSVRLQRCKSAISHLERKVEYLDQDFSH